MVDGKVTQRFLALGGEFQQNFAAVVAVADAAYIAALCQAIRQLYRAVVLELKPLGERTDTRPLFCR